MVFCYWPFHVEYCLALCSHVFSVLFSNVIISLGEERAGLSASHVIVCLFCMHLILSFFSSSWYQPVRGWLRLVLVALPGLFY